MLHFSKTGTLFKGDVHKMPDGSIHTGKTHNKLSKPVVHFKNLSTTAKNKAGQKMAAMLAKGKK